MKGWQDVEAEVLRRIHARDWPPGSAIPHEADLARELGVGRTTVNRALQALADTGWLDRRRKSGTRVALHPVRKATLAIPILRAEITGHGQHYGYRLLSRDKVAAPAAVAARLRLPAETPLLHVVALHLADDRAYVHEDRWINPAAAPGIADIDLSVESANEWLVTHAPFTHGDYSIGAEAVTAEVASHFGAAPGSALVSVDRSTWNGDAAITWVRLFFAPGYRIRTEF